MNRPTKEELHKIFSIPLVAALGLAFGLWVSLTYWAIVQ